MPSAIQPPALPSEVLMIAETQWLFTEAELLQTPSIIEGLPPEIERENRSKGVNFILQVGIMLKLPQITLATASVFLHRFYMRHPMKIEKESPHGFHHYEVGATSLFLATKVEENCRKMKELVIACCRVAQKDPHKIVDEQDKEYWRWRDVVLFNEDLMLEAICFDMSLEPPYKMLFDYLIFFGEGNNNSLRNAAWAFVNDNYLTMLCLLFSSRTIATSALYAAANHCGITFPDDELGRPWWEIIGADIVDIRRACNYMAGVYESVLSKTGKHTGLYDRIPEISDSLNDRTRAAAPVKKDNQSPREDGTNGFTASPVGNDKKNVRRVKRDRDVEGTEPKSITNGAAHEANADSFQLNEEQDCRKKQRMDDAGSPAIGAVQLFERAIADDCSQKSEQLGIATQINGATSHAHEPHIGGGLLSPKLDEVSEEGEVEA